MTLLSKLRELKEARERATQGQWSAYYEGSGDFNISADGERRAHYSKKYSDENDVLCVSGPDSCMMGGEQSENNAVFITGAANYPYAELLEVLEELHSGLKNLMRRLDDHYGGVCYDWKEQEEARAILAKLEGGE